MKLDTFILCAKLICYLTVGIFTPWSVALAQWVNSGEWPAKIIWIGIILPASAVGGSNAVLAFLSNSYSNYVKDRAQPQPQPKTQPEKP